MSVRTYDPKGISIIAGGVELSGFPDGEFLTVERADVAFRKVSGADGFTSRAKTNDRSGTARLRLKQTSPSNAVLSAFAQLDERTGRGVFPFIVRDRNSEATLVFAAAAWVEQLPEMTYSKDIEEREWLIALADVDEFVGGVDETELIS